jgi:hypothetical protein
MSCPTDFPTGAAKSLPWSVTDPVDLSGLRWQRGGYRTEELDQVYTGNDARAALVIEKVRDDLLDPTPGPGVV